MNKNTYEDYYSQVIYDLQKANLVNFSLEQAKAKINSFAIRNNINFHYLFNETKINPSLKVFFQKDPKKQNAAEKAFLNFFQTELPEADIVSLPNGGKNSLQLASGLIVKASDQIIPGSKTVDFILKYEGKQYYITHKRTSGSGGAQKNQLLDVHNFLSEAKRNISPAVIFVAILDGDYYTDKIKAETKHLFSCPNKILVHTSDSFLTYLKEFDNDQLTAK
jgi:hypothetical protein